MQSILGIILFIFLSIFSNFANADSLPAGFVYLKDVDPSIQQDIRYYGYHNFLGRPVKGYNAAECILTQQAANALKKVQTELRKSNLSLKVFDCFRPQMAVDDFIAWSQQINQQQMKAEFYPRVDKRDFFKLGYVAAKSGHTRGSTVDLTIVPIPTLQQADYHRGQSLTVCYAPYHVRFFDSSIDMGTGFDCMDELAHPMNKNINFVAYHNRMLLRNIMQKYGFNPLAEEWWHFTLKDEPFENKYFNFAIDADTH